MNTKTLKDTLGELKIKSLGNGQKEITVKPYKGVFCPDHSIITEYPINLIKKIFPLVI